MKTNSVPVTINIIRGLSGTVGVYSGIPIYWKRHDMIKEYGTNYWTNEKYKYKYNNPDIYPAKHVPQRAATERESVRCW